MKLHIYFISNNELFYDLMRFTVMKFNFGNKKFFTINALIRNLFLTEIIIFNLSVL